MTLVIGGYSANPLEVTFHNAFVVSAAWLDEHSAGGWECIIFINMSFSINYSTTFALECNFSQGAWRRIVQERIL